MLGFKRNLKLYFISAILIINAVVFYFLNSATGSDLQVAFLNVGQGDAIFVTAPGGNQMLVDGGANNSVLRELGKVMPFSDRSINVVVATHADQDHIGGLVEVLKRFQVDLFVRTNTTSTSAVYRELEDLVRAKNIKEQIITSPVKFALGAGVEFDIIFPDQNTAGWETNESSIVGKLIYGQNSFLLTGDSPQKIEKYLVSKYGSLLDSDVLKAGHHGSKSSSAEIFIGTVSPIYSVISAGLNNRYGHPSPEIVDLLTSFQEQILTTFKQGGIIFESDGQKLKILYD